MGSSLCLSRTGPDELAHPESAAPRRSLLAAAFSGQRTGVCLLLGDDKTAIGNTRCHIGGAAVVGDRLRHHNREKDFWDRLIVVTSKNANLTNSHGRYPESRLIAPATQANRVTLDGGCNGRREWIADSGETFGDWESRGVEWAAQSSSNGDRHARLLKEVTPHDHAVRVPTDRRERARRRT